MTVIYVREHFDKRDEKGMWLRYWNTPTGTSGLYETHASLSEERYRRILKDVKNFACINNFYTFQEFVDWSVDQVGYSSKDSEGRIWTFTNRLVCKIKEGSVYSPDTCLFVPAHIEKFFTLGKAVSKHPLGVVWDNKRQMVKSQIKCTKGKTINLGSFKDPLQAHQKWQETKIKYCDDLAALFKDSHQKLYETIIKFRDRVKYDLYLGVETKK